jgi:hypothetical protein
MSDLVGHNEGLSQILCSETIQVHLVPRLLIAGSVTEVSIENADITD